MKIIDTRNEILPDIPNEIYDWMRNVIKDNNWGHRTRDLLWVYVWDAIQAKEHENNRP